MPEPLPAEQRPCLRAGTPATYEETGGKDFLCLLPCSTCTQPKDKSRPYNCKTPRSFSASWMQPTSAPKYSTDLELCISKLCKKYQSVSCMFHFSVPYGGRREGRKRQKFYRCIMERLEKNSTSHKFISSNRSVIEPSLWDATGWFQNWFMSVTLLTARENIASHWIKGTGHLIKERPDTRD